jgi:hypothetical protein
MLASLALTLVLAQTPAVAAAPSDPQAAALLQAVADAQYAAGAGRAVDGFDVDLNLRERHDDTPNEYDFGLQYSCRAAETVVVRLHDPDKGTRVEKGFNGRSYWLRDLNDSQAPLQDLSAHEFEQDRAAIDESLEFSADLLLVLDLAALARAAEGLRLTRGPQRERLLAGSVRRGEHLWQFTLVLPEQDGADGPLPAEMFLRHPNPDPEASAERSVLIERHLRLAEYRRFDGRAIPLIVTEILPPAANEPQDEPDIPPPSRIIEIRSLRWVDQPLTD